MSGNLAGCAATALLCTKYSTPSRAHLLLRLPPLQCVLQGVSWNLGVTAAELISTGAIPPCVCVAIDSAGPYRWAGFWGEALTAGFMFCKKKIKFLLHIRLPSSAGSYWRWQIDNRNTSVTARFDSCCRSYNYLPFPPGIGIGN
jgi:hypothetical protein